MRCKHGVLYPHECKDCINEISDKDVSQFRSKLELEHEKFKERLNVELSYLDKLEEEADKIGGKYSGVLYPKFMLGAYYYVLNNRWSFTDGGNPESFIDKNLLLWINKITHKDLYIQLLNNSIKENKIMFRMLCLRMNYALLIGEDSISGDIKIHKNKVGHLLFHESLKTVNDIVMYDGKLDSAKLKDEEIEEWSNKFYAESNKISESRTGLSREVLTHFNELLDNYGYEINNNIDEVYNELNKLNKIDIEESIVVRTAFLIFVSSIKEKQRIQYENK